VTLLEELQDLELVEREPLAGTALRHRVLARVDGPGADIERLVGVRRHPVLAPEDRVDACDQLRDREGLRDVVVGARFEAPDLVGLLRLRREDDDRDGLVALAEGLADAVPVVVGEHQVEEDAVGRPVHRGEQALGARATRLDLEAFELERVAKAAHDVGLVLDDEDALLRALGSGRGLGGHVWVTYHRSESRAGSYNPSRARW
jgi:hypothetical protein